MTAPFDPLLMLRKLAEHGVDFVVVGGFAGTLYGSPLLTRDLDVCYSREEGSVGRLVDVLRETGATLRGVDDAVPFQLDAQAILSGDDFTFSTHAGPFDILGVPAGSEGYEQLRRNAVLMDLGDGDIAIASLDDLIAMKRAAGRPQDRFAMEILTALREEIEAQ